VGLLEEQAREVLHIGPLIATVLARRDQTGVDFGQIQDAELIFGKAPVILCPQMMRRGQVKIVAWYLIITSLFGSAFGSCR
jgi:hypothetical protein